MPAPTNPHAGGSGGPLDRRSSAGILVGGARAVERGAQHGGPQADAEYEGYMVDLVERLAEIVGFRYRLVPALDGQFGHAQPDGTWSGIIGEVMRGEADIGAGPTVITRARQAAVDFSHAFLTTEASLLMSDVTRRKYFWAATARDVIERTDIQLGTLNRGVIHRALRRSNETLYRRMYDAMAFRGGGGVARQQESSPGRNIGRAGGGGGVEREDWEGAAWEEKAGGDAPRNVEIDKWGNEGWTEQNDDHYLQPLWGKGQEVNGGIRDTPSKLPGQVVGHHGGREIFANFTDTNEEGVALARRGEYAFVIASEIAAYLVQRPPCDLVALDRFLIREGLGLVFQKGSHLVQYINRALAMLRLGGDLDRLYRKWWVDRTLCPQPGGGGSRGGGVVADALLHRNPAPEERIVSRQAAGEGRVGGRERVVRGGGASSVIGLVGWRRNAGGEWAGLLSALIVTLRVRDAVFICCLS